MANEDKDLGIWKYLLTVQRPQQYWVQPIKAELRAQKFIHISNAHERATPRATYGML